jgi:hypothetical protein
MMAGARAVVTNFFHGCVFALLNGKPWATAPSDYRSIKIPDLASIVGAPHRVLAEERPQAEIHDLLDTPVMPSVTERLETLRGQSQAYLDAALS